MQVWQAAGPEVFWETKCLKKNKRKEKIGHGMKYYMCVYYVRIVNTKTEQNRRKLDERTTDILWSSLRNDPTPHKSFFIK